MGHIHWAGIFPPVGPLVKNGIEKAGIKRPNAGSRCTRNAPRCILENVGSNELVQGQVLVAVDRTTTAFFVRIESQTRGTQAFFLGSFIY